MENDCRYVETLAFAVGAISAIQSAISDVWHGRLIAAINSPDVLRDRLEEL